MLTSNSFGTIFDQVSSVCESRNLCLLAWPI